MNTQKIRIGGNVKFKKGSFYCYYIFDGRTKYLGLPFHGNYRFRTCVRIYTNDKKDI
jgi:hypothetical protein